MFTGIVETTGTIKSLEKKASNLVLTVECFFASALKPDQSVLHNGVCLTVTGISGNTYTVEAIEETLNKTNLGLLKVNDKINLERSMIAGGRFDGHLVQGHVDQTAKCANIVSTDGSWLFTFSYEASGGNETVGKGSVCVNGVSLTVADSLTGKFSVAIIPYTFQHTTFQFMKAGDTVNLEFDIIGKYVKHYLQSGILKS